MQQNIHQASTPMIPIPRQLTISPSERSQVYDQPMSCHPQQNSSMNTRQKRASLDAPTDVSMSSIAPMPSPEKKPRTRSKKAASLQKDEIQQQIPTNINQPVQQTIVTHAPTSGNVEVNPFVSKRNEEEHKDTENVREEREGSRSPSVGSSSVKSESVIKEIPLSGERHRLSRSKSPKSRWHHSPSPQQQTIQSATIEEEQNSAITPTNDENKYVRQDYASEKKKFNKLFF